MNKNIIKEMDNLEKQVDKTYQELTKTINAFKFLLKTIKKETKVKWRRNPPWENFMNKSENMTS